MDSNIIFHIDVNSAFLSWTAVKMLKEGAKIDIREVPAIIGGDREKRHGIVLAKSISAKKYGIVTSEPIAQALQKCPNIMIVPAEHDYYREQSRLCMELLKGFTPNIEQVSIDECYMDYSSICNSFNSPIDAANIIKDTIKEKLGFTVNIGISDVKVLAKMASDFEKPDKVHTLYKHEINSKMWPLPVDELYMAGKSSVNTLNKLGIFTIGQLAKTPVDILENHLKSHGRTLWEYANGIDKSSVELNKEEAKGVGNSVTLEKDYDKIEEIEKVLLMLSDKVAGRLRNHNQLAQTVAVEVKYNDFTKTSRQTTLEVATDTSVTIYEVVKILFNELWNQKPIRLLGVRTAKLVEKGMPEQMSIMDILDNPVDKTDTYETREKLKKLDRTIDVLKSKYGDQVIRRASLLDERTRDEE